MIDNIFPMQELIRYAHTLYMPSMFHYIIKHLGNREKAMLEYSRAVRKWKATMPPRYGSVDDYRRINDD